MVHNKNKNKLKMLQQSQLSRNEKQDLLYAIHEGGLTWSQIIEKLGGNPNTTYSRVEAREDIQCALDSTRAEWVNNPNGSMVFAKLGEHHLDQMIEHLREQVRK